MTTTYYAPPENIAHGWIQLPTEEARHAVQVLRKREGDLIEVVDGVGGWHRIVLRQVSKEKAQGEILETKQHLGEPVCQVTIGLALLKQTDRFEFFVEKAVEYGVTAILPLQTKRTEVERLKLDRLQRLMIAAMKQCGRTCLPKLYPITPLKNALELAEKHRFICHEKADLTSFWTPQIATIQAKEPSLFLVGPEGGFTEEEVEDAVNKGFNIVSLGARRLRAETAALTVAQSVLILDHQFYATRP